MECHQEAAAIFSNAMLQTMTPIFVKVCCGGLIARMVHKHSDGAKKELSSIRTSIFGIAIETRKI